MQDRNNVLALSHNICLACSHEHVDQLVACRDSRPALVSRSDVSTRIEFCRGSVSPNECETLEGEKVSKRIAVLTIARFYFFFRSKLANGNVYGTPASRSLASFSGDYHWKVIFWDAKDGHTFAADKDGVARFTVCTGKRDTLNCALVSVLALDQMRELRMSDLSSWQAVAWQRRCHSLHRRRWLVVARTPKGMVQRRRQRRTAGARRRATEPAWAGSARLRGDAEAPHMEEIRGVTSYCVTVSSLARSTADSVKARPSFTRPPRAIPKRLFRSG